MADNERMGRVSYGRYDKQAPECIDDLIFMERMDMVDT